MPSSGPVFGGSRIAVTGSGFAADTSLTCDFCGNTVNAVPLSSVLVLCESPASHAQLCDLKIYEVGLRNLSIVGLPYLYSFGWTIARMIPSMGPTTGGTKVQLIGQDFPLRKFNCKFGDRRSPKRTLPLSSTLIICTTPAFVSAADVRLTLTIHGTTEEQTFREFRYVATSQVHNFVQWMTTRADKQAMVLYANGGKSNQISSITHRISDPGNLSLSGQKQSGLQGFAVSGIKTNRNSECEVHVRMQTTPKALHSQETGGTSRVAILEITGMRPGSRYQVIRLDAQNFNQIIRKDLNIKKTILTSFTAVSDRIEITDTRPVVTTQATLWRCVAKK